eukprot:940941-Rhodomonas_salina.1
MDQAQPGRLPEATGCSTTSTSTNSTRVGTRPGVQVPACGGPVTGPVEASIVAMLQYDDCFSDVTARLGESIPGYPGTRVFLRTGVMGPPNAFVPEL